MKAHTNGINHIYVGDSFDGGECECGAVSRGRPEGNRMLKFAQDAARWIQNAFAVAIALMLVFQVAAWSVSGYWSPFGESVAFTFATASLSALALRVVLAVFAKMIEKREVL